ncbi:serine protease snake-like [Diachasmimorpha longicaudata]|uniref:serine protease snake-like n=1 Tax=Diachasmimorpha longicaudata TaxID=58733 RepID=UPI0030B86AC1
MQFSIYRWAFFGVFSKIFMETTATMERISSRKCQEYAELVYTSELAPVLRIGATSNIVSHCGIVDTPLIVGGVQAKHREFPHQAIIGYGDEVHWQCGGSVISENYILTAAHCIDSRNRGRASKVRVGLTDLRDPDHRMQERNVIETIVHPDYHVPSRYNDIALIKLDEPLTFNAEVRPACLEINPTSTGKFIASGFGKTSYEAIVGSDQLMKVTLDHVTSEECGKMFESEVGGRRMTEGLAPSQICAGVMAGGHDTCQVCHTWCSLFPELMTNFFIRETAEDRSNES